MASRPAPAYLDSSALVKLLTAEAETEALRTELRSWPVRMSSLLASVEVTRTAMRIGGNAPGLAPRIIATLQLLAIDPVMPLAQQIGGPGLRSLDAIHLATAAAAANDLGALITYDHRMIAEGIAQGLPVISPGWT